MNEKKEKWIVDNDDELRLFYGDENFNGSAYPCNDIVFMKMIADKLNKLEKENEELKADNNRLVKETARIVAEHQRKVLNLIDRKIKDYNQQLDDEDIDDNLAYYMNVKGHIEAFKELKKELQE